ncbi:MAG: FG-GAP repeat protein, partial [Chloroflexota bacterium]
ESNDKFGRSLAAGDFNNDGFADLVIGIPFDDIGGNSWGGSILRLNGTPKGLTAADNLFLNELYDINNTILFGYAISVLDFNGDGFSDLVVGASNSSVNGTNKAGAVFTYTNLTNGTFSINYQKWHQGGNGLADSVEAFDSFGEAFP